MTARAVWDGRRRHPALSLAGILTIACLPSLLVFWDRWVGNGFLSDWPGTIRCQWSLACVAEWPAGALLIAAVSGLGILLAARRRFTLDPAPAPAAVESLPAAPAAASQRRAATALIAATGGAAAVILAARLALGTKPSWDYALASWIFLSAWLFYDLPAGRIFVDSIGTVRRLALPLAAHVLLVLTLWASFERQSWALGLGLLASAAHFTLWRTKRATLTPAFWLISLNLVVTSFYLLGWWFSAIGDEYAFFDFADRLLMQPSLQSIGQQLYNPAAVYAAHPGFSSLLQAAGMAVFGRGLFGWRFSGLYLTALSLWPFYSFVQAVGGRRLAILAGLLLASSHYLMSFGKIGYNNLQALFAFAVCLAAAAWLVRRPSRRASILFGAALGLCFFVYPAALLTLPVSLLYAVRPPLGRGIERRWILVAAALLVTAGPLVVQPAFWETKSSGILWASSTGALAAAGILLRNLTLAGVSFLLTPAETHFVSVGFVDVVTAVFVLLGVGALLGGGARGPRAYLLASLALLLVLVGAVHGYDSPPTTRMFLLLPWLAILGAQGLLWLEAALASAGLSIPAVHRVTALLLGVILAVNLIQAYPLSRVRSAGRYQSAQVLLLREAKRLLDPGATRTHLLVVSRPDTHLHESLSQQLTLHHIAFAPASLVERDTREVTEVDLRDPRALVMFAPRLPETRLARLEALVQAAGKTACRYRNSIGEVRLVVWMAPAELWRCAEAGYRW